jgi:hypothetical protein
MYLIASLSINDGQHKDSLSVAMLGVALLGVAMLSVAMLSVVMLIVAFSECH